MSEPVYYKVEKALIAYVQATVVSGEPLHAHQFYAGHEKVDMTVLPRTIIICDPLGGPVAYSGNYSGTGRILSFSKSDDLDGHALRTQSLIALFNEEQLAAMMLIVNKPANPAPDLRIVRGFGLDGLRAGEPVEGRDEEKNLHGTNIALDLAAHLEP